jgi:ABC-type phosphate transport system auxiliary subunit
VFFLQAVHLENLVLKKQLDQVQDYVDNVDIVAEQQMTTLANQVDDLAHALDNRHRDLNVMNKELTEKVRNKFAKSVSNSGIS